jgi:MFS family permease
LNVRFFSGWAFAIFTGVFALYTLYRLGLDSTQTGYLLAYSGLLLVLVQGVAIGRLAKRFREGTLILGYVAVLSASLLGWALTPDVIVLIIVLTPLSFAIGVLNTVINSSISKSVYPEEVGGALGVSASIERSTRVIGPVTGALLLDYLGT